MESNFALGVDIGGSHILAALVNTSSGEILPKSQVRSFVNSSGTVVEIISQWASVIQQSWTNAGMSQSVIGIAMPGPFDYENGICLIEKQEKFKSLFGLNVKELLAAELGILPSQIKFINDASSFLKGELFAGIMKGMPDAVGVTLGTGLGSAYFKDQTLVDADLWRMPFKSGIAEDYLSTRWFVNEYRLQYHEEILGVKDLLEKEMAAHERAALFTSFSHNLANFVQLLCTQLNCNHVVIGGNIAKAAPYFLEQTMVVLNQNGCTAQLGISTLGELAAVTGAATLFEFAEQGNL